MVYELEDSAFMQKIHVGDEAAWKLLYELADQKVRRSLIKVIRDNYLYEECFTYGIVQSWQKRTSFHSAEKLIAFVYTTAMNKFVDLKRAEIIRLNHRDGVTNHWYSSHYEQSRYFYEKTELQKEEVINSLFSGLTRRRKQVVSLFMRGWSTKEIAVFLDISEQTVRNLKTVATAQLASLFIESYIPAIFEN